MQTERDVETSQRYARTKNIVLAAIGHGMRQTDAIQLPFYLGETIESTQRALFVLKDSELLESNFSGTLTDKGKVALAETIEPGSLIDQMAELAAEYTQKMRELGAKVLEAAKQVDA